ncbi:hypothetical protein LRS10_10760 [Phenylobacterium sp. J426]|nr:hypothetical protein [Phenylobacterium sp. J426]MCR5874604.1 hypothetical protein [Phenylobacterium sp. J426]
MTPTTFMWPGIGRAMIITPTKPTITAAQRWGPTFSDSSMADRAVMKRGEANCRAVASVRGRCCTAEKPQTMPVRPTAERSRCPRGRRVFSTSKPVVRQM